MLNNATTNITLKQLTDRTDIILLIAALLKIPSIPERSNNTNNFIGRGCA